jgi:hypothetical protein
LKTILDFIKTRFNEEKINPSKLDIQLIEVLKKIVESGWIIQKSEMKQIFEFVQIESSMVLGKDNYQFKKFLNLIIKEFGVKA